MAVIVGYEKQAMIRCPKCGVYGDYVVVEVEDGVWMCLACVIEFCHDDTGGDTSHSGNISNEKGARNGRKLTL